jgi:hypothetical protein
MGGEVLAGGHDFYATPRVSPDGAKLAWLSWDHPNMPWDGCELWVGDIQTDGSIGTPRLVAGGKRESIFQPIWSPDGTLYFASDRTGFWNIYRDTADGPRIVLEKANEYGSPLWVFSISTFGFLDAKRILAASFGDGKWGLSIIDVETGAEQPIELPGRRFGGLHAREAGAALGEPRQRVGGRQQRPLLAPGIVERRPHRVQAIEIDRSGIGIVARLGRKLVAAHRAPGSGFAPRRQARWGVRRAGNIRC